MNQRLGWLPGNHKQDIEWPISFPFHSIFQASFLLDGWFYADPWTGGAMLEREL